jgi:hypothetical protein
LRDLELSNDEELEKLSAAGQIGIKGNYGTSSTTKGESVDLNPFAPAEDAKSDISGGG